MTTWLISANPERYDHESAFQKYGYIDWKIKGNCKVKEIVYIMRSHTNQIVKYKTIVEAINLKYSETFDDDEFWKKAEDIRREDETKYTRLRLLNAFEDPRLALEALYDYGLKTPPFGSKILEDDLLTRIESVFDEHKDTEREYKLTNNPFVSKKTKKKSTVTNDEFIESLNSIKALEIKNRVNSNAYYLRYKGIGFAVINMKNDNYTLRSRERYLKAIQEKNYKINEHQPYYQAYVNNISYDDTSLLYKLVEYIVEKDWEMFERKQLEKEDLDISYTFNKNNLQGYDRLAVVKNRVNQGVFRDILIRKYKKCCLCGVDDDMLLIASHIQPWAKSEGDERIDEFNGLLLCPNHDKLFDSGLITFDVEGKIIISESLSYKIRSLMNISGDMKLDMCEDMVKYMKYHRENIFKG